MGQFDSAKALIVETAQQLTRKGYLMATGGNLSVRIAGKMELQVKTADGGEFTVFLDDLRSEADAGLVVPGRVTEASVFIEAFVHNVPREHLAGVMLHYGFNVFFQQAR